MSRKLYNAEGITSIMNTTYSQSGNYTAIAGVIVLLLSKLGVSTDVATILTIGGAIVAVIGIIKQYLDHKNLAISAGAISK
jgi:hypothetical protein